MYLIRERFFRLGEDSEITDEHGRPVLQVDGKVLSLRNRLVPRDLDGREVAQVQRKLVAMRPTYQISIAGQDDAVPGQRPGAGPGPGPGARPALTEQLRPTTVNLPRSGAAVGAGTRPRRRRLAADPPSAATRRRSSTPNMRTNAPGRSATT